MPNESESQVATIPAIVQPEGPNGSANSSSGVPTPIPVEVDVEVQTDTNKIYTKDDLVIHNRDGDLWLAIDGTVYDLTKFSEEHPGGKKILLSVAGTDASKKYRKYHGDNILQRYAKDYKIGTLKLGVQVKQSKGLFSLFKRKK
ncbi:cytochrome b5-like heme/steroid binding domain-containing protein [Aspergillus undulatus]|uniref:cytochrome b5-like heme/steroid binding domain-containing protein n=1 Tax=Aspergillus undulatus TaxID=1810928 RepID=UPI003CCC902E